MKQIHIFLSNCYYWLASVYLGMKGYIFTPKAISSKFYLPYVKTDLIQKYIFSRNNYFDYHNLNTVCKQWENGVVGSFIKKYITLDIGSNIGNHSLFFLNECDARFVYCFEPVADTFRILKKNIEINHFESRTKLINKGVGNNEGQATIVSYKQRNTGATELSLSENGDIQIVAIDDLDISEQIGFVKIDVEGFELSVLNGMQKTIKRDKPFIMIEIQTKNFEQVKAFLNDLGYNMKMLEENGETMDYFCFEEN